MPNISAHMIVAKEVGKKLNLTSDDYLRGNLLPDILNSNDSHHKIQSKIYLIPDINYFLNTLDLSKDINIGYLVHLLLDKHYLDDYLSNIYSTNIFLDGLIYKDYDYINNKLINKYKLNTNKLTSILSKYDCKINKEKLKYNIECLNQNKNNKTKYLDYNSFYNFLIDISSTIAKELIEYASKSIELSLRLRQ